VTTNNLQLKARRKEERSFVGGKLCEVPSEARVSHGLGLVEGGVEKDKEHRKASNTSRNANTQFPPKLVRGGKGKKKRLLRSVSTRGNKSL